MRLSEHFDSREFRCRHCSVVKVSDELVMRLELLRGLVGAPLVIVSAFRCPAHNEAVGGAPKSRHLLGEAVDLRVPYATVWQARSAGFRGIGTLKGSARHVDVRRSPASWSYD